MLNEYLDDLGSAFRVIAPYHPGWGESTGLDHIDDMVDMAIYYLDFLDAIGVKSAHVVGHSIGGMIAAEIAAIGPGYVKKLVLNNAVGLWRDDTPTLDFFAEDQPRVQAAVWADPASGLAKMGLPDLSDPGIMADYMYRHIQSMTAAAKFLWPFPDQGLAKRIHRIQAPTLLIWGRHDALVSPAYAEEFHARIPTSRIFILEDSAHFPMIEQREEWSKAVVDFLTE
jgi:pimeloyl-ACP methyl ester carboxylesterase